MRVTARPPRRSRTVLRMLAVRVAGLAVVLWGTTTLAFVAVHSIPGDPVQLLIGPRDLGPEIQARVAAEWGLDRPLIEQYLGFLGRTVQGDLGYSYIRREAVVDVIGSQLAPTVQLAVVAGLLAMTLAVVSATFSAGRSGGWNVLRKLEVLAASVPEFWIGLVLLFVFSFTLGWFPVSGASGFGSIVLPALALGVGAGAMLSQVLREGMEESLSQPYTLSARARGLGENRLRFVHALRNSAVPPLALGGYVFGSLLGGAVVVEQVFGRPGIGRVALQAIQARDVPSILGVALLAAFAFVAVTAVVELLALLIDPRLRVRAIS